jgi:transposase
VHDSAETHRRGALAKQGRRDLRAALVEAAWVAVIHNAHWKARFEKLCRRLSKDKAIVASARQMLVVVGLSGMIAHRSSTPTQWRWRAN